MEPDEPLPVKRLRTCLMCGNEFMSQGPSNRRCFDCEWYVKEHRDHYRYTDLPVTATGEPPLSADDHQRIVKTRIKKWVGTIGGEMTNAELIDLAKRHPPSQSWYDEDFSDLMDLMEPQVTKFLSREEYDKHTKLTRLWINATQEGDIEAETQLRMILLDAARKAPADEVVSLVELILEIRDEKQTEYAKGN